MEQQRERRGRLGRVVAFSGLGLVVAAGLCLAAGFASGPDAGLLWLFLAILAGGLGVILLLLAALGSMGRFLRRHSAPTILVRFSLILMAVGVVCGLAAWGVAGTSTDNARAIGFVAAAIAGSGLVLFVLVALGTAVRSVWHHGGHAPAG